jgi:hypothetical protein
MDSVRIHERNPSIAEATPEADQYQKRMVYVNSAFQHTILTYLTGESDSVFRSQPHGGTWSCQVGMSLETH